MSDRVTTGRNGDARSSSYVLAALVERKGRKVRLGAASAQPVDANAPIPACCSTSGGRSQRESLALCNPAPPSTVRPARSVLPLRAPCADNAHARAFSCRTRGADHSRPRPAERRSDLDQRPDDPVRVRRATGKLMTDRPRNALTPLAAAGEYARGMPPKAAQVPTATMYLA